MRTLLKIQNSTEIWDWGPRIKSALEEFVSLIVHLQSLNKEKVPPSALYEKILNQSGYWHYLEAQKNYEASARMENLQELLGAFKQYEENAFQPTVAGFLEQIALDGTNDENRNECMKGEVSLMTVHGAKGIGILLCLYCGGRRKYFPLLPEHGRRHGEIRRRAATFLCSDDSCYEKIAHLFCSWAYALWAIKV